MPEARQPSRAQLSPERRRRDGAARVLRLQRAAGVTFLAVGGALCAVLVLFPSGSTIAAVNRGIWELFQTVFAWMPHVEAFTAGRLESFWNIVMFVPLGLGLTLLLPRWWWIPLLHLSSIVIETVQYLFFSTRSAELVDVLMNSTGGMLGVAAGIALDSLRRRLRPPAD